MKSERGAVTIIILVIALIVGALAPIGLRHVQSAHANAKIEKADQKLEVAKSDVVKGAQELVHKGNAALASAPASRPVEVAKDFFSQAQALLDQQSPPAAADVSKWQDLVSRLLSENAAVRAGAEKDRADDTGRINDLSDKLVAETKAHDVAEEKFRVQAAENARVAAMVHKAEWIIGALAAFWFFGQVLAKVATPGTGLAAFSGFVNSIAAPAVQGALTKAHNSIESVGTALGYLKATAAPEVANLIAAHLNAAGTSDAHLSMINDEAEAVASSLKPKIA